MCRPRQRLGAVVDTASDINEERVDAPELPSLRAHERLHIEVDTGGGRAIALAADLPTLVD